MKVLLGVGGDEDSRRALERTVERVRETGDDLTVAVMSPADGGGTDALDEIEADVRGRLSAADVDATVTRLSGGPAEAASRLVDLCDSGGFDRLVIGGGSQSPMGKIQLDDAAEFVVLNARTTVTLVR